MTMMKIAALLLFACLQFAAAADAPKPNVLIILADDLGYSDLGCYGSEIATPNLDALAKDGLRFTQFYNTARCWPSRAALLTGYYAQQVRRDTVPGIPSGTAGKRPAWAPLLSERLKPLGYRSYHSGKWHVDGKPLANGFDHSYSLDDHDRYFAPRNHTEDDVALPPIAKDAGYYATTAIAEHAIKCLKEHAEKYATQPFFEFLAFTAPHFPIQAPAEDIARYQRTYTAGWDVMRDKRWERMHAMSIGGSALAAIERELGPPYSNPGVLEKIGPNEVNRPVVWETLNADQQRFQAGKMSVHAAMVDRMDREIGRVLAQVKAMGAMENTLVVFLSDNGASAEMMVRGDGNDRDAVCGTGATFLHIGPGWSSLANTPFRRHKTWVHEGGISTPCIMHWPKGVAARGELRTAPAHLIDIVPTVLELAGGQRVEAAPGLSLVPLLAKEGAVQHESLWWMHEGNRALRVGDWKLVAAGVKGPWELYDLSDDRSESRNVAAEMPEKVAELAARWTEQAEAYFAVAKKEPMLGRLPASKVLVLGNSITLHGPAPQIGWTGNWGMAATAEEKDFVHLLAADVAKATGVPPELRVRNIADFERGSDTYDAAKELKAELEFSADLIVLAIAENVPEFANDAARDAFAAAVAKLLATLQASGKPAVFVRSSFWPHAVKDAILKQAAADAHATFIDISALGADESNAARSERKIEHAGVAGHPGDKGMRAIADAIFKAMQERGKE